MGGKCSHGSIEIISQSNVNVADVLLGTFGSGPLRETLQEFLDGNE
jgi:hypothetical protein